MLALCEEYKLESLQKKIAQRCINMTESAIAEDCSNLALMEAFKFADKYKINIAMNKLASHIVSLCDSYSKPWIEYENARVSLKEACESKWQIGNHGLVKIMACMVAKHVNERTTDEVVSKEVDEMLRSISELEIK